MSNRTCNERPGGSEELPWENMVFLRSHRNHCRRCDVWFPTSPSRNLTALVAWQIPLLFWAHHPHGSSSAPYVPWLQLSRPMNKWGPPGTVVTVLNRDTSVHAWANVEGRHSDSCFFSTLAFAAHTEFEKNWEWSSDGIWRAFHRWNPEVVSGAAYDLTPAYLSRLVSCPCPVFSHTRLLHPSDNPSSFLPRDTHICPPLTLFPTHPLCRLLYARLLVEGEPPKFIKHREEYVRKGHKVMLHSHVILWHTKPIELGSASSPELYSNFL